jgi:hypothetical protein
VSDFVQSVDQKICERWHFTISELSCEFPQISHTFLYSIITVSLCYHEFCARLVLKMLMDVHKMQLMTSALTFLERYHKDSDGFLSHIVTGDEIWVSFVNVETKEQARQWMHTYSPNKLKRFKQMSARKLMATVLGLKHCRSISTGSCLTTLIRALISLQVTTMYLPTRRTGWDHSTSTDMRNDGRFQNVAELTSARFL